MEQLSDLDDISYQSMMGEYILYYSGKIGGVIYDDRLLVKKTSSALELMPVAICDLPYQGAKEMLPVNEVDSKEFLTNLFDVMYDELLKLSFQFHHTRMDGAHAGRFLEQLQENIDGIGTMRRKAFPEIWK